MRPCETVGSISTPAPVLCCIYSLQNCLLFVLCRSHCSSSRSCLLEYAMRGPRTQCMMATLHAHATRNRLIKNLRYPKVIRKCHGGVADLRTHVLFGQVLIIFTWCRITVCERSFSWSNSYHIYNASLVYSFISIFLGACNSLCV